MNTPPALTDLPVEDPPALWDVAALARRLGVTERFVRRLVHERRIPFLKIGKFVSFDTDDIADWLSDRRSERVSSRLFAAGDNVGSVVMAAPGHRDKGTLDSGAGADRLTGGGNDTLTGGPQDQILWAEVPK